MGFCSHDQAISLCQLLQFGRTPADYSEDVMGTIDHENLRRAINHFYTSVYVQSTNFDFRLKAAVSVSTGIIGHRKSYVFIRVCYM